MLAETSVKTTLYVRPKHRVDAEQVFYISHINGFYLLKDAELLWYHSVEITRQVNMASPNLTFPGLSCSDVSLQSTIIRNPNKTIKHNRITDFSITNILKEDIKKPQEDVQHYDFKTINGRQDGHYLKKRAHPLNEHISSPWVCWAPLFYSNPKIAQQIVTNFNRLQFDKAVEVLKNEALCSDRVYNCSNYTTNVEYLNVVPGDNSTKTTARDVEFSELHVRSKEEDKVLNCAPIVEIKQETNHGATCTVCQKVFADEEALKTHAATHVSRYYCEECDKGFSQLRNFRYHVSVHRGTGEFRATCPECGKTFNDRGYLSSHMKIHRNRKEYACPHCPKCFNQRVAYNMHVRIHTGVKPHKCLECGKCFSRKMLLRQHARTHSGEKPYQCPQCHKPFADRSNMTLHLKLHSGIKPFSCPICPKAFSKKHHLKTHMNYHTGSKPYACPHKECGQRFSQSSNMRTHAKKCPCRLNAMSS